MRRAKLPLCASVVSRNQHGVYWISCHSLVSLSLFSMRTAHYDTQSIVD